jgi:hypothetical protein
MKICTRNKQSRLSRALTSQSTPVATLGVVVWLLLNLIPVREANAQGMIVFNNFVAGKIQTHVYGPLAASPNISQIGNAATGDLPVGATSWAGYSMIGAVGNPYTGPGTLAELLAAPGLNQPEASLQSAYSGGVTSFRSGIGAGMIFSRTPTFNNIPPEYPGATVEMLVWDNRSGQYPNWAAAESAWLSGAIAAGSSGLLNVTATIGGPFATPPYLFGLRSFNLYFIPEPSLIALAGLGAAALMNFRRRK